MAKNLQTKIQTRTFPTNTVLQTRLGFFAPGLNRPPENDSRIKYLYVMENGYGKIAVRNVCLTQIHAKVLRALCTHFEYQEEIDGEYFGVISAKELLRQLEWPRENDYYWRLLKVLDDLQNVSIHIESFKGSMKGGSISNYHVIEHYEVNEKDPVSDWKLKIQISSKFAELCDKDLGMIYPTLAKEITYLRNGLVESIVNFLLSHELTCFIERSDKTIHEFKGWKGKLKDILDILNYTTKHDNPLTERKYTDHSIREYLEDLRPVWNPDTKMYEDSPATKDLREKFEIHINWKGVRTEHCEVYYDKKALEEKHKSKEVPYVLPVKFMHYKKIDYSERKAFPSKKVSVKSSNKAEKERREENRLRENKKIQDELKERDQRDAYIPGMDD